MKKVLALILVLGMASMASAGLQLSVDGVQNPVDSEIVLLPSEKVTLDIWTDADIPFFGGEIWAAVVEVTQGKITGGDPIAMGDSVTNIVNGATQDNAGLIPPAGQEGVWGLVRNFQPTVAIPAGATLVDGIEFHCEGIGETIVTLYGVVEGQEMVTMLDQIIIHQIPEPMTLSLLGLGGLALIRRRRA